MGKIVRLEICKLCSNDCGSVLRKHDVDTIKSFSWDALYTELADNSPVLLSLLEACSQTETERVNRKAVVCMCVVLLLKNHFAKMCLVQKIISLVLYSGHADKMVRNHVYYKEIVFVCMYRYLRDCRS